MRVRKRSDCKSWPNRERCIQRVAPIGKRSEKPGPDALPARRLKRNSTVAAGGLVSRRVDGADANGIARAIAA